MLSEKDKIIPYTGLTDWLTDQRDAAAQNQSISRNARPVWVQCHGVFDLLHIGHIRYLQRARQMGDFLIVTLTPDRHVNKGPNRPAFGEQHRAAALAALDCVDAIVITESPTASESLQIIQPQVFAKGAEFQNHSTPELKLELDQCEQLGIQVEYINDVVSSSTELLNRFLSPYPVDTTNFIDRFRERYDWESFELLLASITKLKVAVIGDSFVDEIYECEALTQSARAPIVATRYQSHQQYPAGAAAVAGHLSSFCEQVTLITTGQSQLQPLLPDAEKTEDPVELMDPSAGEQEVALKRRYLESYFSVPMFEINFNQPVKLSEQQQTTLKQSVRTAINECDLILIWDQAYGLISSELQELLNEDRVQQKLAVCVSWDAASFELSRLNSWSHTNFFQLGEQELHLLSSNSSRTLEQKVSQWLTATQHQQMILTRGQHGCWIGENGSQKINQLPSLATQIVDRTGAQEAFFAMASLATAVEAPLEQAAFLGNLAGAQSVAQVSTEQFLTRDSLLRHLKSLLK